MTLSAVAPLVPNSPAWTRRELDSITGYPTLAFWHPNLRLYVISAVEVAEPKIGPEYHLTISKQGKRGARRCNTAEAAMVLTQFAAWDADEDNHTSVVRSYWLPVDQTLVGHTCPCRDHEAVVREGDFVWRPLHQRNYDFARRLHGVEQA